MIIFLELDEAWVSCVSFVIRKEEDFSVLLNYQTIRTFNIDKRKKITIIIKTRVLLLEESKTKKQNSFDERSYDDDRKRNYNY